jgi:hypothetical protein
MPLLMGAKTAGVEGVITFWRGTAMAQMSIGGVLVCGRGLISSGRMALPIMSLW